MLRVRMRRAKWTVQCGTTGQQLTKLMAFHDSLSTWAVEGRNAKPKKSNTSTQVMHCLLIEPQSD